MAENEEELKSLLIKMREESKKADLKLNIKKMKIMAYSPTTSWQIDVETARDFIFLGSRITLGGGCSHKIKTLGPWKKSYDKPRQRIKKQRHHFVSKGLYCPKLYFFSSSHVWM